MKKVALIGTLISILPFHIFAVNNEYEKVDFYDEINWEQEDLFPSLSEMVVTINEARDMIQNKLHENQNIFYNFSSQNQDNVALSREFSIYLLLQEAGISFLPEHINLFDIKESFIDIDTESFFSPYVLFARKVWIIQGYEDWSFQGKNLITKSEFENITSHIQKDFLINMHNEYIALFNTNNNNIQEDDLIFSSASNQDEITDWEEGINIQDALQKVKKIQPFEHRRWYSAFEDNEKISLKTNNYNQLYFPKIDNIEEYILYFDYSWIPFLSKKEENKNINELVEDFIQEINKYRNDNKLNILRHNTQLEQVAQRYAQQMFETKLFEHTEANGKNISNRALDEDYNYSIVLENIWKWPNIEILMEKLKESQTHNENLLNTEVEDIWIWFYGNYWVQVFWKEFK